MIKNFIHELEVETWTYLNCNGHTSVTVRVVSNDSYNDLKIGMAHVTYCRISTTRTVIIPLKQDKQLFKIMTFFCQWFVHVLSSKVVFFDRTCIGFMFFFV